MIDKNDVQCISFYKRAHPIHEAWMKEVSSRKIIPYIPENLMWIKKNPILTQFVTFLRGLFMPSAKVYFVEAAAIVPALFLKRGKVICINSDTFFYNIERGSTLVRIYSKLLLKRINGFISTSEMMQKQTKMSGKPSEIVYPFMENESLFKINPDFKNNSICNIAGTRYTKGADILLETFKKYKKSTKDAKLYVLGPGEGWVKKVISAGGEAPGFVPVEPYYKKCSIYINPARHEPFGVNILEAMAAGIPPLVSEKCGAAEIVRKIDKNLVVSLKPEEIVRKINWLKSNHRRYNELSKKCKVIAKKFSKESSCEAFKIKFTKLLERIA